MICVFSLVLSSFLYFIVHMCECHMSYLLTYCLHFTTGIDDRSAVVLDMFTTVTSLMYLVTY